MVTQVGITPPLFRVGIISILVGGYSCLALIKPHAVWLEIPHFPVALDAALSFAMAMLISFRVNRAYERWWEARTLWGQLVNISRLLAVKVRELQQPIEGDRNSIKNLIVGFAYCLKEHLLGGAQLDDCLPEIAPKDRNVIHPPSYIVGHLYRHFEEWNAADELSDQQLWVLDVETRALLDVCGGCERIKNTPMSKSWRVFTWQCITLYLIVLPWGLVDNFGYWTIPISMIAAYVVMAAESIAHNIEIPFGKYSDQLDLDGICLAIERSVREILDTGTSETGSDQSPMKMANGTFANNVN